MRKIQRNDTVLVIAGKDKGKHGKVQRVLTDKQRVLVEGVNMVKRHLRARPGLRQAGIVQKEASLHVSNVKFICPSCGKSVRLAIESQQDGSKARVCKSCREAIV